MTLSTEINNILSSKGSKSEKRASLIKIGLRPNETSLVMTLWDKDHKEVKGTYTFGVEIECNVRYQNVRGNGVVFQHMDYNHTNSREVFKFVSDGSVHGNSPIECVSPILGNNCNGFKKLKAACDALNEQNATVNRSCGLHVHVDASALSGEAYSNVFVNYMYLEDLIDSFMAESRRANNAYYCKTLAGHNLEHAHSIEEVQTCFVGHPATRSDWRGSGRYYKVNAMSYVGHKTVEFRQMQGSTNYEKISQWVKFCIALVDWSKTNRLTHSIDTIDEIPFLNKQQKIFFKKRQSEFASRVD